MKENKFLLVIAGIISGCVQVSIIIGMIVFPSIIFNSTTTNSFSENGLKQESSYNGDSSNSKSESIGFFKNGQSSKNGFPKEIIIYNMPGNRLMTTTAESPETRMNIELLPIGVYLIKIGEQTKVFVKE